MASGVLHRRFLGRVIRPYPLAVSLATAVVVWSEIANFAIGRLMTGIPGDLLALMAAATVGMLWWGWWAVSDVWMARGLLWSAGVWSGVTTLLILDHEPPSLAAIAACWALASAGAWLIEVEHERRRHER